MDEGRRRCNELGYPNSKRTRIREDMTNEDVLGLFLKELIKDDLVEVASHIGAYVESPKNKQDYLDAVCDSVSGVDEVLNALHVDDISRLVYNVFTSVVVKELKYSQKKKQVDAAVK